MSLSHCCFNLDKSEKAVRGRMFSNEASALLTLKHRRIVRMFGYTNHPKSDMSSLVLEFPNNSTLAEYLRRVRIPGEHICQIKHHQYIYFNFTYSTAHTIPPYLTFTSFTISSLPCSHFTWHSFRNCQLRVSQQLYVLATSHMYHYLLSL